MDENNQRFESFLREFQPRRPRALLATSNVATRRRAAAAVVTLGLATSLWFLLRSPAFHETRPADGQQSAASTRQPGRRPISSIALTHLALENPASVDAALAVTQQSRLPRFDRQNSVLRVLAKE